MSTNFRDAAVLATALLPSRPGLTLAALGMVIDPVLHRIGRE